MTFLLEICFTSVMENLYRYLFLKLYKKFLFKQNYKEKTEAFFAMNERKNLECNVKH